MKYIKLILLIIVMLFTSRGFNSGIKQKYGTNYIGGPCPTFGYNIEYLLGCFLSGAEINLKQRWEYGKKD